MKRYIRIEIPVKPYIKAYMIAQLGEMIKLSPGQHAITNKIYDLLERSQNWERIDSKCNYGEKVTIYLTYDTFRRKGHNLNATNVKNFNRFVEKLAKWHFYTVMDSLMAILPSFEGNLPEARKRIGIDLEYWSDDSMKKDYYRYRLKNNLPLLYDKTFGGFVPSEKNKHTPF